ncbi:bifunctional phosphoribosylaminoimidazolecarboxamide formyltransferase/IMP cyclohydrolase [Leptolyngbya sp. FACHB-261]|uniref:bifunctional phosphoribosylaminoimidazolecarboxamide formyltransferase/IMP cyclohydrolase n=1 Tax=Leptolyngbya sp. FACHB-261 TaxID=2692806 RepID=UPI001687F75A|nr:bifunctional phosphoribosylaminoimidazolecarboxamide formyltransferase/IMP cyclohydrolase [Leptolyngbya sp. FACHB-261]MBD2102601.1 bifunctional phosphoribosylaminoimidazolecarboxamide formyltransferase/IMP cyclohydrolase [Leptolyngbya sp. FACHB-261]
MPRLALLSTSDKTGLLELARALVEQYDFELISSGGTAKALIAAGLPVTKVSDYTGSPEILGGRVKTLHPKIHGGILARRDQPQDLADLQANNIRPIDLVVVNLYPFEQTVAAPGASLTDAIEQIDIGGPTLIRASAKNHAHVTILCDATQYESYLTELSTNAGQTSPEFRAACAYRAFSRTLAYDRAISAYLGEAFELQDSFALVGQVAQTLRYGENPHQSATWYQTEAAGWSTADLLQGKELSYNNLVDLEAARRLIAEFAQDTPTAAILKHTNPCGVAQGSSLVDAYRKAFAADATSAFGGIVALNRPIDASVAEALTETFLECIVAPGCEPEAQAILAKKSKVRVLILPELQQGPAQTVKVIAGGFLLQASDEQSTDLQAGVANWRVVTQQAPTSAQLSDLEFAWKVCKHVKSNAIVVARDGVTLGVGAGQMNRVGSAKIALEQAGERAQGAVLASDGFFPFDDTVRNATAAGISAFVQPGGSLRDGDSIKAADELGVTMLLTDVRHFLH